jgi:ProQ/FINO family
MIQKDLSPGFGTGARKIASAESRPDLPKTPDTASPIKKKSPDATVEAVILLLAERWPAAFKVHEGRRKPLKVGIHLDVMAAIDGAVTAAAAVTTPSQWQSHTARRTAPSCST